MKRRAFNLFCLVSMLIFAASVALWVRSYFTCDTVAYQFRGAREKSPPGPGRGIVLAYSNAWGTGRFIVGIGPPGWNDFYRDGWNYERSDYTPVPGDRVGWPQFFKGWWEYEAFTLAPSNIWTKCVRATFPNWLFLPFAIPPILWLRKRRTNRGRGQGGFAVEAVQDIVAER